MTQNPSEKYATIDAEPRYIFKLTRGPPGGTSLSGEFSRASMRGSGVRTWKVRGRILSNKDHPKADEVRSASFYLINNNIYISFL